MLCPWRRFERPPDYHFNVLRVQPKKCHSVFIEKYYDITGKCSFKVNGCSAWKLNGEDLHLILHEESKKYLGMQVNTWAGIVKLELIGLHYDWIWKIKMLNSFAVPRLIYKADHGNLKGIDLNKIDVQRSVEFTHPRQTSNTMRIHKERSSLA